MPTIPASVGTSVGWNGNDASLPRTKNTVSPTPAPTASTATSVRPTGLPSGASGCSTINLMPCSASSLCVTTMSPMTLASCMLLRPVHKGPALLVAGRDLDVIDDADNRGVHRTVLHARRHARRAAADNEYGLSNA